MEPGADGGDEKAGASLSQEGRHVPYCQVQRRAHVCGIWGSRCGNCGERRTSGTG